MTLPLPLAPLPPPVRITRVLRVLKSVRVAQAGLPEERLQLVISQALTTAGIDHTREKKFAKGCRADFWIERGIVIEVKKRRPVRADLIAQLTRYAQVPGVKHLVVMLERSIVLPPMINGVPLYLVSMNAAWGIAV
jgi:hypothetical protein